MVVRLNERKEEYFKYKLSLRAKLENLVKYVTKQLLDSLWNV